jgi:thiol-disulfide isomerase/thioredoxin
VCGNGVASRLLVPFQSVVAGGSHGNRCMSSGVPRGQGGVRSYGKSDNVRVGPAHGGSLRSEQAQKTCKGPYRAVGVGLSLVAPGLIFVASWFALPLLAARAVHQVLDKPAPAFTLQMLDGTSVSLASLSGHVVVLDFWGTWCAPCVAEMPALGGIYSTYRENSDVIFLMANSELNGDTPEKIRRFAVVHHVAIPVALDTGGAAGALGAEALPSLVVLDQQGHIRMINSGFHNDEQLRTVLTQQVESLLRSAGAVVKVR